MGKEQTSKQYMLNLATVHGALIVGQVIFAGCAFYLNFEGGPLNDPNDDLVNTFQMLVPVAIVSGILVGRLLASKRINKAKKEAELKEKLDVYKSALIMKWALLEFPGLFALIAYLLFGHLLFMTLFAIPIVIFVLERPTKEKVIEDLELESKEREQFKSNDAIVAETR